ncbi:hypothetical protein DCO58_07630 [Helicobacter saguini]|uniref:Uncharacterized protein n=1 Tax=Helicobacter saguini TaxID=1548018 RepID=A0A6B0HR27_9HELI|nr:hypothetical protein [Helicobacter saguini]MWV67527.1 hypothetical protein [Helicobacter saguini]MWV69879.1 hypothetical protein [Helicobacter saguini]MWV72904.1 hypothetical protein [Helicobacter saguini]
MPTRKDFIESIESKKPKKARLIVPIINANYFKQICFVMLPNRILIELVSLKES